MTALRNFLFIGTFIITMLVLVTTMGKESASEQAEFFLKLLSSGDRGTVISLFGDNSCHCQPRGGYKAYLCYESGENDNLSFLVGKKVAIKIVNEKQVPTENKGNSSFLPFETPESMEVDLELNFEKQNERPYFLPLDMAYGYEMKEADLLAFCQDPSSDFWKGLALRLRPSLAKGMIKALPENEPGRKAEYMSEFFLELLPREEAKYLRPADPGAVLTETGKSCEAEQFEKQLPRLKSTGLRLYIGRRGMFQRWAIKKGRVKDPVFLLSNGKELKLKSPPEALLDRPGQGALPEEETQEKEN